MQNTIRVLECLRAGMQIDINIGSIEEPRNCVLSYDQELGRVAMVGKRFNGTSDMKLDVGEDVYVNFDLPINNFIHICEQMTDKDIDELTIQFMVYELNKDDTYSTSLSIWNKVKKGQSIKVEVNKLNHIKRLIE